MQCATGQVCFTLLRNPWTAGKMAKEEVVAGKGEETQVRTKVLKLTSGLIEQQKDDSCFAF